MAVNYGFIVTSQEAVVHTPIGSNLDYPSVACSFAWFRGTNQFGGYGWLIFAASDIVRMDRFLVDR
jgi:hypothetical protein